MIEVRNFMIPAEPGSTREVAPRGRATFRIDTTEKNDDLANMKLLVLGFLASLCTVHAAVVEESMIHAGVKFRVVKLAPEQVTLVWKDAGGVPYRSFEKVQAAFAKQGKTVRFIMNAGIFEPGGIPSGLHIENRKTLHPLNLADAPGNFFLKPNGVLWIEGGARRAAFVSTPQNFQKREKLLGSMASSWLELAVQSGPLLLIEGKRHPAFIENSKNKLLRNGVGVAADGRLIFAITAKGEEVNFWDFAGLFLKLGCKNALFLDGTISQMVVNPTEPASVNQFGSMFVVAE